MSDGNDEINKKPENNGKYLSVIESSKATNKDYTKLLVTDEMLEYVFAKYGNKWHLEDDIADVILEDLWMKYGKYDKGKGKVHDLENIIEKLEVDKEANHAEHDQLKVNKDDKGKGKVHDLDLENRIKKLEVNFGSMLKAKKAKQAENDHLKVNKEVIQISSDRDVFSDEDPQDLEPTHDKLLALPQDPELPQDKFLSFPLPKLPQDKLLPLSLPMHMMLQLQLQEAPRKRKSKKP
ncbi:hypothetical protein Tco_1021402 [Tanacetum coccineum]